MRIVDEGSSRRLVTAAIVAAGLLVAGSAVSARSKLSFGIGFAELSRRSASGLFVLIIVLDIAAVLVLFVNRARQRAAAEDNRRERRIRRIVAVAMFAAVMFVIVNLGRNDEANEADDEPAAPATPQAGTPRREVRPGGLDVVTWLLILCAATGIVLVVGRSRNPQLLADDHDDDADDDVEPLRAATVVLAAHGDPRLRVIGAYAAMEHALGATERRTRHLSAGEYLAAVSSRWPDVGRPAAQLTVLFERARFSHLEIGEPDAHAASELIREIRSTIQRTTRVPAGPSMGHQ